MSVHNEDYIDEQLVDALISTGFHDLSMVQEIVDVLVDPSEFADLIGISHAALEELIYNPELLAIVGISTKFVVLLQKIGIMSVAHLSLANPADLQQKFEVVARQYPVGSIPKRAVIAEWVKQARTTHLSQSPQPDVL